MRSAREASFEVQQGSLQRVANFSLRAASTPEGKAAHVTIARCLLRAHFTSCIKLSVYETVSSTTRRKAQGLAAVGAARQRLNCPSGTFVWICETQALFSTILI